MNLARSMPAVMALCVSCFAATAQGQTTARIFVGFPAGGPMDTLARTYAEKLAEAIGRPVVVENRVGASGQIALVALKASAPDGNTLMVVPDAVLTLNPHTIKTPAYDTLRDFVPIAHLGSFDYGLAIGANVPAKDLREWLNGVKSDSKNAAYATTGSGTIAHLLGLLLAQAAGVQLVNVPFRGAAPALTDLMAGQVPAAILTLGALARQAKSGKIRILAHTGGQRSSIAPEVPTFKELGYPALEASGWYGMVAPAGIRPELVARYHEIFIQAQRNAAVRDRIRAFDLELLELTPAELAGKIKAQYDRWGQVVKSSGFNAGSQ